MAIDESEARATEVIEFREQMKTLNEQIDGQALDAEIMTETLNEVRAENDRQERHIAYLQSQLREVNATDRFLTTSEAYIATVPVQAETSSGGNRIGANTSE